VLAGLVMRAPGAGRAGTLTIRNPHKTDFDWRTAGAGSSSASATAAPT